MIPTSHLYLPSTVALVVFLLLGTVDGLFLHLGRYRLSARPASRREHLYHTIAAVTFAATLPAVFLWETGGLLLWTGVLAIAAARYRSRSKPPARSAGPPPVPPAAV